MKAELERLLAECPDMEESAAEGPELAQELDQIDRTIDRLMSALAEGTDLTMPYVNRTIEKLEAQRSGLLERQTALQKAPRQKLRRLSFASLDFEQKKLVAAQFIQEIKLSGDIAEVSWNI